ncbi:MAG: hypothetical protein CMJ18_13700 [Phycisphaeraceae bacterium]|nr:hypothetical protein [Phycisphaeraceae bacterium]
MPRLLVAAIILLLASIAGAHELGEGYVFLKVYDERIDVSIELNCSDLDRALGIDQDGDGLVRDAELAAGIDKVYEMVRSGLGLGADGQTWELTWDPAQEVPFEIKRETIAPFATLYLTCKTGVPIPVKLDVTYRLVFEVDPEHTGYVIVQWNGRLAQGSETLDGAMVIRADRPQRVLDLTATIHSERGRRFVKHGAAQMWTSPDRLLLIVAVMMQIAGRREDDRVLVRRGGTVALLYGAAVLATLGPVGFTPIDVLRTTAGAVAALLIVVTALHGLLPWSERFWIGATITFGLADGFSLAGALPALGLVEGSLALPWSGFALGVQAGQVVLVMLATWFAARLCRFRHHAAVSSLLYALIAFIATLLLLPRAFDVTPVWEMAARTFGP